MNNFLYHFRGRLIIAVEKAAAYTSNYTKVWLHASNINVLNLLAKTPHLKTVENVCCVFAGRYIEGEGRFEYDFWLQMAIMAL